ncbi:MAG TPA: 5'-nucleotidase C-terminal domain-containing protein [Polyangiaceae bacterium]|nr:5'-nucleotidase C-terminal domain-containing protein [Polyangiaceae bacterium]
MRGRFGWLGLSGVLSWACTDAPAREQAPRAVTLLHTADIHSRLWPFRSRISRFEASLGLGPEGELAELGGVARLATRLNEVRQRGPALWLDSGDVLEGAAVFQRFRGSAELELMSSLGLDAMALGNHELSLSGEELAAHVAEEARFPVLSANLQPEPDSPLVGQLLPSVVLNLQGLRVGVIGVANTSSPPSVAAPGNAWGLAALPSAGALQLALDELAGRAAFVVVLSHLGLDQDRELVAGTSGIDLLLGGHQHIVSAEPEWQDDCQSASLREQRGCSARRVPIVHSGAYARWLSRLELTLSDDQGPPQHVELDALKLSQLPLGASVARDPGVDQYLEPKRPEPEPPWAFLPEPVARRAALGGDAPLGDLAADAMLAATGADVALLNTSGLRADLEAGELLRSDLELAFPFDEPWRLALVDGGTLRRGLERAARRSAGQDCTSVLQVAGLELKLDCAACLADSSACVEVRRRSIGGVTLLGDAEALRVALPKYLTLGGADFRELAGRGAEIDGSVVDALAKYLQRLPPSHAVAGCRASLERIDDERCREAFGPWSCPLDPQRTQAICLGLPQLEVARDERIVAIP